MEATPQTDTLASARYSHCDAPESSPVRPKETPRQKLSASLRERLRRSRRAFTSPLSVAKRLCVEEEEEEEEERQVPAASRETANNPSVISFDANRNEARSAAPEAANTPSGEQLSREVKGKTETLRRLRMVQMYRSKNDLTQLQTLIDKWRRCAQAALLELQSDVPVDGRKASLSELIDLFGLDDAILHFDRTQEDFTS